MICVDCDHTLRPPTARYFSFPGVAWKHSGTFITWNNDAVTVGNVVNVRRELLLNCSKGGCLSAGHAEKSAVVFRASVAKKIINV